MGQRKSEKEAWLKNASNQATVNPFFVGKFNLLTFQVQFASSGVKRFSPFFAVQSRLLNFSPHTFYSKQIHSMAKFFLKLNLGFFRAHEINIWYLFNLP